MKQFSNQILLSITLLLALACNKQEQSPVSTPVVTPPTTLPAQTLSVTLTRNEINADGFDETIIRVLDKDNVDVTAGSVILINNVQATSNIFFTAIAGTYQVKATRNQVESAVVAIKAVSTGTSPFKQKVLAEMYTGTWCGICPGAIIPLEEHIKTKPEIIYVGIHGPMGSGDPYTYLFDAQLRNQFGVGGVPSVIVNRANKWDGKNSSLDQLTLQRAPLGLAIESSISGNTVSAKVKVRFDVSTSIPLKIVVALVEDNLIYNQANYGHYGLPNPIVGFKHQNVLRNAGTDIFGDKIPVAQQIKNNTWQKEVTLNIGGFVTSNCRLVAFVVYDTNTQNRTGVLNAQIAPVGQIKNFD